MNFPNIRLKRNKQKSIRPLVEQDYPGPQRFIWPVFVVDGEDIIKPIDSLPGQFYYSIDRLSDEVKKVIDTGVGGVLVFGVIDNKLRDEKGSYAFDDNGLVQEAVRILRKNMPDLAIFADVGLTGYTKSGHAQIIENEKFDNDGSLELIKKIALSLAKAGATGVAPSGMIDGQVMGIRDILDKNNFKNVLLMSYSTKFNSNMYRTFPFDTSSGERSGLDRGEYLESYRMPRNAIRESILDEAEGADVLMIKPSLFYLDIIKEVKDKTSLPLAVYNVSGEYAMVSAMIEKGYAEKSGMVRESLCALNRAGADIIISYWANQYKEIFGDLD